MTRTEITEFLHAHTERVSSLHRDMQLAYWKSRTTGKKEHLEETARLETEWQKVYANAEEFRRIQSWLQAAEGLSPLELRSLRVLSLVYTAHQKTPEEIEKVVQLETQVGELFTNFRGSFRGRQVSSNEIDQILAESNDSAERRAAWEASKEIGPQVADLVLELVNLRNAYARHAGYQDHFSLSLALGEIDEEFLWKTLGELQELSGEPFRQAKAELDRELAGRFGCAVADLRPWHYADPFFQRAPRTEKVNLDQQLADGDPVQLAVATYERLGLDIRDLVERSDLYAREGKDQTGFCMDVDREGDIRVLVNLEPNERWTNTLLHEYGHAIYDKHLDPALPWLLREPAHIITTEAVALLMGRLVQDPLWLREILKLGEEEAATLEGSLRGYRRLSMLVFLRWGLTMVHFEQELYRRPDQDLDRLWWDLVAKFQGVTPPEGRSAPDWASKLHLALAPVYYQNYILGELMASQLKASIQEETGNHLIHSERSGAFLRERLFRPGNTYPWTELLERATGEPLSARHFLREFVE